MIELLGEFLCEGSAMTNCLNVLDEADNQSTFFDDRCRQRSAFTNSLSIETSTMPMQPLNCMRDSYWHCDRDTCASMKSVKRSRRLYHPYTFIGRANVDRHGSFLTSPLSTPNLPLCRRHYKPTRRKPKEVAIPGCSYIRH